jgi:hypothetical protein
MSALFKGVLHWRGGVLKYVKYNHEPPTPLRLLLFSIQPKILELTQFLAIVQVFTDYIGILSSPPYIGHSLCFVFFAPS